METQNDDEFNLIRENRITKTYQYEYERKYSVKIRIMIVFDLEKKEITLLEDYMSKNDIYWNQFSEVIINEKILNFIEQKRKELFS